MNPNLFAIDGMLVNIDDLNNPHLEGFLVNLVFAQASARSSAQKQLEAQKVSAFLNEISLVMAPPGPRAGGWSNSHLNRGNKETFIKLLLTTASLPELTATFDNQSTDPGLSDLIKFGASKLFPL